MPAFTSNPTLNATPDPGQGGAAVTSNSNTGHGSTLSGAFDGSTVTKTCVWQTFKPDIGQALSITLKIGHSSTGGLSGVDAHNLFRLQYSVDGGSNWINAIERIDFTSSSSGTFSVALSAGQDISLVRVRDIIQGSTGSVGETADSSAEISDIRLEVVTQDSPVVALW